MDPGHGMIPANTLRLVFDKHSLKPSDIILHHDLNTYSKNDDSGFGKQFEDSTENRDGCNAWYSHPRQEAASSRAPLLDLEVLLSVSGGTRWMRRNLEPGARRSRDHSHPISHVCSPPPGNLQQDTQP